MSTNKGQSFQPKEIDLIQAPELTVGYNPAINFGGTWTESDQRPLKLSVSVLVGVAINCFLADGSASEPKQMDLWNLEPTEPKSATRSVLLSQQLSYLMLHVLSKGATEFSDL